MSRTFRCAALSLIVLAGAVRQASGQVFLVPDSQYPTIQSAIDGATSGDTVRIKKDATYTEAISLKDGVTVEGEYAATTVLAGGVTGHTGGILRKVRIEVLGLTAANADGLTIQNNIFRAIPGTALAIQNSANIDVSNNTFSENGVAVSITAAGGSTRSGTVEANIFDGNTTAVAAAAGGVTVSYNHFFDNGSDAAATAIMGNDVSSGDPLFVAPAAFDFHLKQGSPCIDADPDLQDSDGSSADLGAYGGPGADPIPFAVSGVSATLGGPDVVQVAWDPNLAYNIDTYEVSDAAEQDSSNLAVAATVDANETQAEVTVTPPTATAPSSPVLTDVVARSGALLVRWQKAAGADGYVLLYGNSTGTYPHSVDVADVSQYTLQGLQNGIQYYVAVKSYAETAFVFSVACTADGTQSYPSTLARAVLGDRSESPVSNELSGTPAELPGWPPLEDNGYGCFIESAAGVAPSRAGRAGAAALAALLVAGWALSWRRGRVPGARNSGATGPPSAPSRDATGGRRRTRRIPLVLALLVMVFAALPARAVAREPRVAFSLLGGAILPHQSDWSRNYDHEVLPTGRASVGFRLTRFFELGVDAGFWRAKGRVTRDAAGAPLSVPADQTLSVIPADAYVLLDLAFVPDQLLVPYLGGGYSRYFYRREIAGGDTVRGHLSGYHGRAGLKLLLNRIDPQAARAVRSEWGLQCAYWVIEADYAKVDDFGDSPTDLGGWTFLSGFSLAF